EFQPTGPSEGNNAQPQRQDLARTAPISLARHSYAPAKPFFSQVAREPRDLSLRRGEERFIDVPVKQFAQVHQHFFTEDHGEAGCLVAAASLAVKLSGKKNFATIRHFL
ncbi:unnamed protein product, partial [Ectocarpus sp. 12 AP-2014]